MRMVGTVALDVGRLPGSASGTPPGDVAAAVGTLFAKLLRAAARNVVTLLRTRGPALVALLASARPGRRLVAVAAQPLAAGGVARRFIPHTSAQGFPRAHTHHVPVRRRELALPADATAPRAARALLQEAAADWEVDDELYHDAAMVVTELVANAVDHAGTPSTVTVDLDDGGLRLAVRDASPDTAPRPRPVDPLAPRGRGLQMVDALAASWGVSRHADGKTVWAVLRRG
jgi:anti-sigma regulatory factor (Ser/Thr protein kinase)